MMNKNNYFIDDIDDLKEILSIKQYNSSISL